LNDSRLARVLAVACVPWFLQGCTAGLAALQVVPSAIGMTAAANADDLDAWQRGRLSRPPTPDEDLATLDARIRRAACGDAESQYWLATSLNNSYNETPDKVEIYAWFRLARSGGYTAAAQPLAALETSMTESAIASAEARASAWRPTTEDCPVEQ